MKISIILNNVKLGKGMNTIKLMDKLGEFFDKNIDYAEIDWWFKDVKKKRT